nr:MAG TPA: hypothetical protein [Caudoviricetes sp.]
MQKRFDKRCAHVLYLKHQRNEKISIRRIKK